MSKIFNRNDQAELVNNTPSFFLN